MDLEGYFGNFKIYKDFLIYLKMCFMDLKREKEYIDKFYIIVFWNVKGMLFELNFF